MIRSKRNGIQQPCFLWGSITYSLHIKTEIVIGVEGTRDQSEAFELLIGDAFNEVDDELLVVHLGGWYGLPAGGLVRSCWLMMGLRVLLLLLVVVVPTYCW